MVSDNLKLFSLSVKEPVGDPVVNKYVSSGLPREAVALAVLNYGDNPIKVLHNAKFFLLNKFTCNSDYQSSGIYFFPGQGVCERLQSSP